MFRISNTVALSFLPKISKLQVRSLGVRNDLGVCAQSGAVGDGASWQGCVSCASTRGLGQVIILFELLTILAKSPSGKLWQHGRTMVMSSVVEPFP